jgi:hypothetical protein
VTTTDKLYGAPATEPGTATTTPDLLPRLNLAVRTVQNFAVVDIAEQERLRSLREDLVRLSLDPDSLDRDVDIDIWRLEH